MHAPSGVFGEALVRAKMKTGLMWFLVLMMMGVVALAAAQPDAESYPLPRLDGYKIYFSEANGEPSRFDRTGAGLSRLGGLLWQLGATLETLDWRMGIPSDADLIIMAGPNGDLSADATARLWSYLDNNGRLLLLSDPPVGRGRDQIGLNDNAAIVGLIWSEMGIRLGSGVIVTENNTEGQPPLNESVFTSRVNGEHPAAAGLTNGLAFNRARPVDVDSSLQRFQNTPLVFTPDEYYGEVSFGEYLETGKAQYNIGQDVPRGRIPLAAVSRGVFSNTRVALIGDRTFATNDGGLQTSPPRSASFLYPDNARFLVQVIGWLLDADPENTTAIAFPTPGPTATPTVPPTPLVVQADLDVQVTVNDTLPRENDAVVFEIVVSNNGPETAIGVLATITLPENAVYVSSAASTRRGFNDSNGIWDLENMGAGASGRLSLVLLMPPGSAGQTINLSVSVDASGLADPNPQNNTATLSIRVAETASTESQ
jgi:uncharacterized repeat protein (TIGR01451 family)